MAYLSIFVEYVDAFGDPVRWRWRTRHLRVFCHPSKRGFLVMGYPLGACAPSRKLGPGNLTTSFLYCNIQHCDQILENHQDMTQRVVTTRQFMEMPDSPAHFHSLKRLPAQKPYFWGGQLYTNKNKNKPLYYSMV